MQAEIESVAINGGWMVLVAVFTVWIALVFEGRTRKLSALQGPATQEAVEAQAELRLAEARTAADLEADRGHLAAAVVREEQSTQVARPEPVV